MQNSLVNSSGHCRRWHSCMQVKIIARSRPNWILGSGPNPGSAGIWGSHGPENGVARWWQLNSEIYSQNDLFGLVYDMNHMIYQFLDMEAKNYKFDMFRQQCHPSVAPWDGDIRLRNASRIHTGLPFVYIIILSLWRNGETNQSTKISKIHVLFWIVMPTFRKSCHTQ